MEILIKKVDLSDETLEIIYSIVKLSFNREFDFQVKKSSTVREALNDSKIYLLYSKNIPIGYFSLLYKSEKETELHSIALHPEFQGKGIGSEMVDKVIEITKGKKLSLTVHPQNSSAIRLYLKKGFIIADWKENCFGDGQPRLLLEKICLFEAI